MKTTHIGCGVTFVVERLVFQKNVVQNTQNLIDCDPIKHLRTTKTGL
jgi:hypothetical protein